MIKASIGKETYVTKLEGLVHHLLADEPVDMGGKDLGPSPDELLASSLASCVLITLRMYADRKEWPLEGAELEVTFETNKESKETVFIKKLRLLGDLDESQRARLLAISNLCPIHKLLTNPVTINTELL